MKDELTVHNDTMQTWLHKMLWPETNGKPPRFMLYEQTLSIGQAATRLELYIGN
jgi:hypothetical protein